MKTQTADEADARFLANIGVVLAAGTLAIGVVLVSSLPPSQNNVVAEITLPAVMTVADMQPISPLFDYQDHSTYLRSLAIQLGHSATNLRDQPQSGVSKPSNF